MAQGPCNHFVGASLWHICIGKRHSKLLFHVNRHILGRNFSSVRAFAYDLFVWIFSFFNDFISFGLSLSMLHIKYFIWRCTHSLFSLRPSSILTTETFNGHKDINKKEEQKENSKCAILTAHNLCAAYHQPAVFFTFSRPIPFQLVFFSLALSQCLSRCFSFIHFYGIIYLFCCVV